MSSPHLPPESIEVHGRVPGSGGTPGDDPRRTREFRPDDAPPQREMSFFEHLDDLRGVIVRTAIAIALGAIGGWWLAPIVLEDLIARTVRQVSVLSPFEAFNERLKLAVVLGGAIALPVVLWQIWSFVVPGLLHRERRWIPGLVAGSMVLFVAGVASAYLYVIPIVIHVLDQFVLPGMITQIRVSSLLDFCYNLSLACGLLAQLPMVTMLLTAIGLVTPKMLLQQWRVALVIIFIATAAITPGDVVSAQVIMGIPMTLLYFLSVALSTLVAKRQARAESEPLGGA